MKLLMGLFDLTPADAYVFIKSYRILTTDPPIKISLTRGEGWWLPKDGDKSMVDPGRMSFVPFQNTAIPLSSIPEHRLRSGGLYLADLL